MILDELVSKCRSCLEPIVWMKTRSGKNCPVDLDSMEQPENEHKMLYDHKTMICHFETCKKPFRKGPDASRDSSQSQGVEVPLDLG